MQGRSLWLSREARPSRTGRGGIGDEHDRRPHSQRAARRARVSERRERGRTNSMTCIKCTFYPCMELFGYMTSAIEFRPMFRCFDVSMFRCFDALSRCFDALCDGSLADVTTGPASLASVLSFPFLHLSLSLSWSPSFLSPSSFPSRYLLGWNTN